MSKNLELQLEGTTNFTFDVDGSFEPRGELVYLEASESPTPVEIRYSWRFTGYVIPSDGTTETLWDDLNAFRARLESTADHPEYARIVRDPDGDAEVVWLLDNASYEQLRIEEFEFSDSNEMGLPRSGNLKSYAAVTLVISAVKKNADADGIVGWQQEVSYSSVNGLRQIEWRTRVTTRGGDSPVSAETKARTFGAIDITLLGDATWAYETGNTTTDGGADVEILDADERTDSARTPTVAVAVSRVVQQGVAIGATGAGSAPDSVLVKTRTVTTAEETVTTTRVEARGPNAQQAGLSHKPANVTESETETGSDNVFTGVWTRRVDRASAESARTELAVVLSGGRPVVRPRAISSGYFALVHVGGRLPYEARVDILRRGTGAELSSEDLLFPPLLSAPWQLDYARSSESEPVIDGDRATDPTQTKWARRASLFYVAGERPNTSPLEELRGQSNSVKSYVLDRVPGG